MKPKVDAFDEWTPEKWERARLVLSGEDGSRVSWSAAARAAGVRLGVLRAWIRRSREKRPDDDPVIHEMCAWADDRDELVAGRLEDVAWERAVTGWEEPVFQGGELIGHKPKFDNTVLMKMLPAKDPTYRPHRNLDVDVRVTDESEIYQRLLAGQRLALAKEGPTDLGLPVDFEEGEFEEVPAEVDEVDDLFGV